MEKHTPTFEQLPAAIEQMREQIQDLIVEVKQLRNEQPVNDPPIDSKVLMQRLAISEPTLIRMRKRKEIPFLTVCGQYRYVWAEVVKALQTHK